MYDSSKTTFCIKPWLHTGITSGGTYRACCECVFGKHEGAKYNYGKLTKKDGSNFHATVDSIESTRNAQLLKDIRASMIQGKKHHECKQCWDREALDNQSVRIANFYKYIDDIDTCLENTEEDGTINTHALPLKYFDIRLGTTCNLKCRMCGPTDSSLWLDDHIKLFPSARFVNAYDDETYEIYKDEKNHHRTSLETWDTNLFLEDLMQHIPNMDRIYMTGGEPTAIRQYWDLLELIIEKGYSENISLEYNSNMFLIPKYAWDIWKKFKHIQMVMSIDGIGKVQEYIRSPSKWNIIERNINLFHALASEHSNIDATMAPTITVYNVLHIPDFIKWYLKQNFTKFAPLPNAHISYGPNYLTAQMFPKNSKHLIVDKYNELFKWAYWNCDKDLAEAIEQKYQAIVDFCLDVDGEDITFDGGKVTRKDIFLKFNTKLDKIRSESLEECIPELHAAIEYDN